MSARNSNDMHELARVLEGERVGLEVVLPPADNDSPAPLEVVLETKPATLDDIAERIAALEGRIEELDLALTRQLRALADQLARLGAH